MMNNIIKLKNSIKNTDKPLALIYLLFKSEYSDTDLTKLIKYFFKFKSNFTLNYNLLKLKKNLKNKKNTLFILEKYYFLVNEQILILKKLKKIRKIYNNKLFWKKTIDSQHKYINNKLTLFLSIFNNSKGNVSFYHKIELINKEKDLIYFSNEIQNRLKLVYKLLGYEFFKNHKIVVINELDYCNMTYKTKVKYLKYVYLKVFIILKNYSYLFNLYKINQKYLDNIINQDKSIEIEINNFDSEIDYNDIIE